MSRPSVADVALPPLRYRPRPSLPPSPAGYRFETRREAARRDRDLVERLTRASAEIPNEITARAARRLARRLQSSGWRLTKSVVSHRRMRRYRQRIAGQLWQLLSGGWLQSASTFTLVPDGWTVPAAELNAVDPTRLIAGVRTDLYRAGAAAARGFLFAYLDGEYDPAAETYQLHLHGLVTGQMRAVLERLRQRPKYRSIRKSAPDGRPGVWQRLRVSRQPLSDLPHCLTYLLKAFWGARATGDFGKDGVRRRVRQRRRIPEPYHTQHLLWLDRWRVQDLSLLVHFTVSRGSLRVTPSHA